MEKETKNLLIIGAAGVGITAGIVLAKKAKKLSGGAKLTFSFRAFKVHSFDKNGLKFNVSLRIYNPTKEDVTVAPNQIVANYDYSPFAYSTPSITGETIKAGSTRDVDVVFDVAYLSLIGKGIVSNASTLKHHLTFKLTITVNGETVTLNKSLSDNLMSGLGQVVSGPRNTRDGSQFNNLIKKAEGKEITIKSGDVDDVVAACIDIVSNHYLEVEGLAHKLKGSSLKDTCANIFAFAYPYLQYHLDSPGVEELRTPARSWYDGQIRFKQQGIKSAGIDCDDFSIFCGALLKCLNIPFKFRITKYDGKANYQHIYVVVPSAGDSEDEIIIDPVLSKFDYQKPYSDEKSTFDMSPIRQAGFNGFDGLSGLSGLGMPIQALSGLTDVEESMMSIVSGVDFDNAIEGLGSADDATLKHLRRTRDFITANPKSIQNVQNPAQFLKMLNMGIDAWNTPSRDAVFAKLALIEDGMISRGSIKSEEVLINGIGDVEMLQLGGFFKRISKAVKKGSSKVRSTTKKVTKKTKKAVRRVAVKTKSALKKAGKAIVKYNPLTIAMRGGLLAAFRFNIAKMSSKLCYAYLPDSLSSKYNIDVARLRKLKSVHSKVRKLFRGLQGKESNLKSAILKGSKKSGKDFSLEGCLGVVATAASVTAASGLLATISKWMKPLTSIFKSTKSVVDATSVVSPKSASATVPQSPTTPQKTTTPVQSKPSFFQRAKSLVTRFVAPKKQPQDQSEQMQTQYEPQAEHSAAYPVPQANVPEFTVSAAKKGMKTSTKLLIGGAALATGLAVAYAAANEDKSPPKNTAKHASKKSLGGVDLK